MRKTGAGFTLPELLVTIILAGFFSSLILYFTFNYWQYGYLLQADENTLTTRLNASDVLREEIGTSTGLIIQDGIADTRANAPDPNNNQYWLPIHAIPGNKPAGASGTYSPLIYFKRYSLDTSGNYIMNGSQPYEDEYVLYLDGTNRALMQRTLVNPDVTTDKLKTSCPPAVANSACPADKTIATDLASVDMRYFSRVGNLIDYTSIWDPNTNSYVGPDFPVVEVVEFTLNLTKKPTFQKTFATSNSTIIRIALRNS
ncbi:type II secretion system GspH family protein [Candidatus Saccharibacteria bacterium]|nr:type II secretion system GspH family protein [Candidatus Saccharibacteria bacterium]